MLIAVETGATTSTLFLITVLLLLNMNAQTFAVAIELCVGRAYAITVLYNSSSTRAVQVHVLIHASQSTFAAISRAIAAKTTRTASTTTPRIA
jgi:hypothetical protein